MKYSGNRDLGYKVSINQTILQQDIENFAVLDTQVSIGSDGRILYKFYEKPKASPVLLQAESAMDERTKRAILTQEGVRRLLNTSLEFQKKSY